jgi:transposase
VRRRVGRGKLVELHPEAVAFAAHHGFTPRVCWPERPQAKGRVERTVELTREKVGCGREHATLEEWQAAWEEWLPLRRAQVHRTHGKVNPGTTASGLGAPAATGPDSGQVSTAHSPGALP